jgi:putative ABC transport system permease protein
VFSINRMGPVFSAQDYFRFQKRKILRIEDYEAVEEGCTECTEVGVRLDQKSAWSHNGHSSTDTDMRGITWTMVSLDNLDIGLGRGFTPADDSNATHNAIVGYDIVDNLLGDGDPIGKEIRVGGIPYTGRGRGRPPGQDARPVAGQLGRRAHLHLSADLRLQRFGQHLRPRRRHAESMERAKDEVRVMMRARRHNAVGQPDDFEIQTNDTFLDIWKQISAIFFDVVIGIASISLVVGGIVIMNIMLVSVTERTREIGVRKALGAGSAMCCCSSSSRAEPWRHRRSHRRALRRHRGQADHADHRLPHQRPVVERAAGPFMATATGIFFGVYPVVALRARQQSRQAGPGGGAEGAADSCHLQTDPRAFPAKNSMA